MAKQFDNDQVAVLQRIIHEHEYGLDALNAGTREMFGSRQKPLTYSELAAVRRMIAEAAREAGRAAKYADGLLDTFLPPRSKTSTLLTVAADMIDAVAREFGLTPGNSTLLGKDWKSFTNQLRERAMTFQKLDQ
jgi:hypothetical protein